MLFYAGYLSFAAIYAVYSRQPTLFEICVMVVSKSLLLIARRHVTLLSRYSVVLIGNVKLSVFEMI